MCKKQFTKLGASTSILDICKLSHGGHLGYANQLIFALKQYNLSEGVQKKNRKDRMNIGDSRACTLYIDFNYPN